MRQTLLLTVMAGMLPALLAGRTLAEDDPPAAAAAATEARPDAEACPDAEEATKFLRVVRDARQRPTALETAVTRYASPAGQAPAVEVDLIGAVHVGDAAYYRQLNELFQRYEVVLYELVAPPGTRISPDQPRANQHPVTFVQQMLKNVLNLEFQLDAIDYTRENLVHADMSPAEFAQSMKDRGETFLSLFIRLMMDAMAAQSNAGGKRAPSDIELLVALMAKDRALRLKRVMADQFENLESQLSSLNGPQGSTLITERNKKALEVLRQQLDAGKTRVGIFYGAGHLSDMEERLVQDFGLRKVHQQWLTAWQISPQSAPAAPPPAEAQGEPVEADHQ